MGTPFDVNSFDMNAAPSVGSGFSLKSWVTNRKRILLFPTPKRILS